MRVDSNGRSKHYTLAPPEGRARRVRISR